MYFLAILSSFSNFFQNVAYFSNFANSLPVLSSFLQIFASFMAIWSSFTNFFLNCCKNFPVFSHLANFDQFFHILMIKNRQHQYQTGTPHQQRDLGDFRLFEKGPKALLKKDENLPNRATNLILSLNSILPCRNTQTSCT